ncbi:nitroreductase family protein [Desulfogranum marinum]|uniref:nitroreductase family protein n=1 Tax=Desulfogranum marinum TaxID=453220 RepID=UPI0029C8636B|nr:nitroreductase family protein [Desulfogranum marinum]
MAIEELVGQTRTVRRFTEDKPVPVELLKGLVDTARLSGSARNGQVLKYMLVTEQEQRDLVFPLLGWAGYLSDWKGPEPGERPAAYILCLLDKSLLKGTENEAHFDCGIATQSMLLAAAEQGVYGCRIGAFAKNIDTVLNVAEPLSVMLVLALGYPAETVVLEEVGNDGKIQYWRDEQGVHHVPKRSLEEVLVESTFSAL